MSFDTERAIAILNTAKQYGLNPHPLPEDDKVKVDEAKRLVAMAKQSKEIADSVGKEKVTHYDAVMAVLAQADVLGGANEDAPSSQSAQTSAPASEPQVPAPTPPAEVAVQPAPQLGAPAPINAIIGGRQTTWTEAEAAQLIKVGAVFEIQDPGSLQRLRVATGVPDLPMRGQLGQTPPATAETPTPTIPEDQQVAVTVEGIDAVWAWQDVVTHVVINANTNLTVNDEDRAAELELLVAQAKVEARKKAKAAAAQAAVSTVPQQVVTTPTEAGEETHVEQPVVTEPAPVAEVKQGADSVKTMNVKVEQAPPSADGPQVGDVWADAQNNQWRVTVRNGALIEVESPTGEKTIVGVDFLINRVLSAEEASSKLSSVSSSSSPGSASPSGVTSEPETPSASSPTATLTTPSPQPSTAPTSAASSVVPPQSPASGSSAPEEVPPSAPSTVVASSSSSPSSPPSSPAQLPSASTSSSPSSASSERVVDPLIDDDEGNERYGEIIDGAHNEWRQLGLPLPYQPLEPPAMPDDPAAVDAATNRRLHLVYNACANWVHRLLAIDEKIARDCAVVRDAFYRSKRDDARKACGKGSTITEQNDWIREHAGDDVNEWIRRHELHSGRAKDYEHLYRIYTRNVETLSRDWTMQSQDEQGSR